jgi:hypothetical protein
VFVRVHVGAQNSVHAGKVALALPLEPLEHVAVNAKMHGRFAARHDNPGTPPKIFADRLGFRRIDASFTCAASDLSFHRA